MRRSEAFCPDWVSAPGDTIGDALREQDISVAEFANRMGQTIEQAKSLLSGGLPITIAMARKLEAVIGGSVEFWMSRDFNYRQPSPNAEANDNTWLRTLPFADMVRFGWLKPEPKRNEELAACLRFFGVSNVAAWHRSYAALEKRFSFRTSSSFESNPAAVAAWLRQGEIEAAAIKCAPWSAAAFQRSFDSIRLLIREKDPTEFVPILRKVCAESGVAVTTVRSPKSCRASGATRFVAKDKALLLLSFRFLSDDQFWFSFFHEAGHLLLHSRQEVFIEGIEHPNSDAEHQANEFAARILIPEELKLEFLSLRARRFELARFARKIGVSPGIVVGQLQHYGKIRKDHFNGLKRRYRWE